MAAQNLIERETRGARRVAPGVYCLQDLIVNVCFVDLSASGGEGWILVDAGMPNYGGRIMKAAEELFGCDSHPMAIVLTHGHFDHVGAVNELAKKWDVSVWAHVFEVPYITGKLDYPPPDPSVGGLMARVSPLYPRHSINLGSRVKVLPHGGSVPPMPGWSYIHTPGHTPGHISLFREVDRVLIAGDAFTTVKQESAAAVLTQKKELHGPPSYFTVDWKNAWGSVRRLEELKPSCVVSGHGRPMSGEELSSELKNLAENFDKIAIPNHGRYV